MQATGRRNRGHFSNVANEIPIRHRHGEATEGLGSRINGNKIYET